MCVVSNLLDKNIGDSTNVFLEHSASIAIDFSPRQIVREFDVFLIVNGVVFLFECKTGASWKNFAAGVKQKYELLSGFLGVDTQEQNFMVISDMNTRNLKNAKERLNSKFSFVNLSNLHTVLEKVIEDSAVIKTKKDINEKSN
jgi:hypothetical protein